MLSTYIEYLILKAIELRTMISLRIPTTFKHNVVEMQSIKIVAFVDSHWLGWSAVDQPEHGSSEPQAFFLDALFSIQLVCTRTLFVVWLLLYARTNYCSRRAALL